MKPIFLDHGDHPRLARIHLDGLWAETANARELETVLDAPLAVAIVGTREPSDNAAGFAGELAAAIGSAGGVVVSGGAFGIDAAAHRGAIDAGVRTWAVAPTGFEHAYPLEHAPLYRSIVASGGAMLWPFAPDRGCLRGCFSTRNRVLVALCDAVVIVQAGIPSGALNAAKWCRRAGVPLYVVSVAPWEVKGFEGSRAELERGARPLTSIPRFLRELELLRLENTRPALSHTENAVVSVLSSTPAHVDEIAVRSHLPAHTTTTALLTLALENVVVEGPAGFFRRANPA